MNNIPADIYISSRIEAEHQEIFSEFAFASSGFDFVTSVGNLDQLPIRAHRTSGNNVNFDQYINYYGFDVLTSSEIGSFDTSECFTRQERLEIRLTFPFKNITTKDKVDKAGNLAPALFNLLATQLKESLTRFTVPRLSSSEDGNLYVRLAILPSPPAMALFSIVPGKWLLSPTIIYHNNVEFVDVCARYCVADIQCLSFDFSQVTQRCFLNSKHSSGANLGPSNDYSHYSRNTLEGMYSRPSDEIYALIDQLIRREEVRLQISSVEAMENIELIATSIINEKDAGERTGTSK